MSVLLLMLTTMMGGLSHVSASETTPRQHLHRHLQQQYRINVPPFAVRLSPTGFALGPDLLDRVHNAVEQVASTEFRDQAEAAKYNFRYLLL